MNIVSSHLRMEKGIRASVLRYIPEVPVALGEIFRHHGEVIVIPLQVAVFAGIQIEQLMICKLHRFAAPQYIVHIRISAISVEGLIARPGRYDIRKFLCQLFGTLCLFPEKCTV